MQAFAAEVGQMVAVGCGEVVVPDGQARPVELGHCLKPGEGTQLFLSSSM